jgi:hypothetical protein
VRGERELASPTLKGIVSLTLTLTLRDRAEPAPAAPPRPKRKTFASLCPNRTEKPGFCLARLMQLHNLT